MRETSPAANPIRIPKSPTTETVSQVKLFMLYKGASALFLLCFAFTRCGLAAAADSSTSDSIIVAEAEEFTIKPAAKSNGGWERKAWGENYYCATFGNTFLSRKAFLGASEQSSGS